MFYILKYVAKLHTEKLNKYNPINNVWRCLSFSALASVGNHQYFNLCQNYRQMVISLYSSLRFLVIRNIFACVILFVLCVFCLSIHVVCPLLH